MFLVFFALVAYTTTCCMTLFVSTFTETLGVELNGENLSSAAKVTFLNVILLSVIFCVIDAVRRIITVERPVKRITESAEKITKGDFSVRIEKGRFATDENFAKIIDCFNIMAEELGSVETLRTDFIANVSHKLKTLLAVIQNYGTMLQSPDLPDDKRIEYAKVITESSRRLASLITNILKLNKLENQQGDTSHAMQGNGLGLALVKRVVDIMQGEITVKSEVGKGSIFSVTLKRSERVGMEKAD